MKIRIAGRADFCLAAGTALLPPAMSRVPCLYGDLANAARLKYSRSLPQGISLYQVSLCISDTVLPGCFVRFEKDIDVFSFYTASTVLGSVDDAVDQHFASVRNDSRVHGYGMVGCGNGAGACPSSPSGTADAAWTVGGSFVSPQRCDSASGQAGGNHVVV